MNSVGGNSRRVKPDGPSRLNSSGSYDNYGKGGMNPLTVIHKTIVAPLPHITGSQDGHPPSFSFYQPASKLFPCFVPAVHSQYIFHWNQFMDFTI